MKYLFAIIAALPAVIAAGCSDDISPASPPLQGDALAFEAVFAESSSPTRSGLPVYTPLVLHAPEGPTLYLHSYTSTEIGRKPGDVSCHTRGMQVSDAATLASVHGDFKVSARFSSNSAEYFSAVDATPTSTSVGLWAPVVTKYWPADESLDFTAVAPASQWEELRDFQAEGHTFTFDYAVPVSGADRDAEAQPDLLLAASSCSKPESIQKRAPLQFHHALSAIKFAVRDVLDGRVKSISITDVYGEATCIFDADQEHSVAWSAHRSLTSYTQKFDYTLADRPVVSPGDDSHDLILQQSMPEKTFMLLPQEIPADAAIEISLARTGLPDITVRGLIRSNEITQWLPGHEYVYTISTSRSNWVYVLEATGNYRGGAMQQGGNTIFVYSPSNPLHAQYGDKAYFDVKSYRYRANDPSYREALPWQAAHGDGLQYSLGTSGIPTYIPQHDVAASEWISDPAKLRGQGSVSAAERHNLDFAVHHQLTDWPGDLWMQAQTAYPGNSKSSPWDLSTCGGARSRNTANCYVVDREGWYSFPAVYGNAIKNGVTNTAAYSYSGPNATTTFGDGLKYLQTFTDYAGAKITGPNIASPASASMLWSDVYNCISDVSIDTSKSPAMVKFRVNRFNLQQGTAVIGVKDASGQVMWSWHIWMTEHWLNPSNGQPHAYDTGASAFQFQAAEKSGWRRRGDLPTSSVGLSGYTYYVSPYNLGWCDPKNVDYLRRASTMEFVQMMPDGNPTGLTASLPILQEGEHIEYKVGNNTYYQFGRKDPFVGFHNHENVHKPSFGPMLEKLGTQTKSIATAIKNPNTLYCKGTDNDWVNTSYVNLWNNTTAASYVVTTTYGKPSHTNKYYYNAVKTVYDPCPPGYMVPPASMWKMIGTGTDGTYTNVSFKDPDLSKMKGTGIDDYTFAIYSNPANTADAGKIWLTSTGHRWYTDSRPELGVMGGDNFNPHLVYLWSCTPTGNKSAGGSERSAWSTAIGKDTSGWGVSCYFNGRRSMARPVRAMRETYSHP